VSSDKNIELDFVGLNTLIVDPVIMGPRIVNYPWPSIGSLTYESMTLGHPHNTASKDYLNTNTTAFGRVGASASLNALLNNRHGPYGNSSWKQMRVGLGTHPVIRKQRENNILTVANAPPKIDLFVDGNKVGETIGLGANSFTIYHEPVYTSRADPLQFIFEDNRPKGGDPANNVVVDVSYGNNVDHFSNEELNNTLNLNGDDQPAQPYDALVDAATSQPLSAHITFGGQIYPKAAYSGQARMIDRTNYSINSIWKSTRNARTAASGSLRGSGPYNSLGIEIPTGSVWMLDARLSASTTVALPGTGSTAGELQNTYEKYSNHNGQKISASSTYIVPFIAGVQGDSIVLAGDHPWTAADTAKVEPYKIYKDFRQNIRVLGQHHTLVPEFRISEVFDAYVTKHNSNFLTRLSGAFSITGSALSSSTQENFFKVFSTTDFLKHFNAVDDKLNEQTNGLGQTIRRGSIKLQCAALMQFLPYKGFYPAERATELGAIFSRSFAPVMEIQQSRTGTGPVINGYDHALWRIPMEPFFAPGILFNTIKSGIAVGNYVVKNTSSYEPVSGLKRAPSRAGELALTASRSYRESCLNSSGQSYTIPDKNLVGIQLAASGGAGFTCGKSEGYYVEMLPFDALRFPEKYLGAEAYASLDVTLPGARESRFAPSAWIYDRNAGSGSFPAAFPGIGAMESGIGWRLAGSPDVRYGSAIDNFCCNVVDFFQPPLKTFVSNDEAEFGTVKKGQYYSMDIVLQSTPTVDFTSSLNPQTFGMYSRASAFGAPALIDRRAIAFTLTEKFPTYAHVTPPYFNGAATARIIYSASANAQPSLNEIWANAYVEHFRPIEDEIPLKPSKNPSLFAMQQLTSSVDIFKRLLFVPPDTNSRSQRWAVQSRLETPVLNFYDVPVVTSRTGSDGSAFLKPSGSGDVEIRGMWHQLGNKLNSREGVYLSIVDSPTQVSGTALGLTETITVGSLRGVVGFESQDKRIGDFAESKTISEAVVVIPFKTVENQRTFFNISPGSKRYHEQRGLLQKYIFPPTFDYLINPSVKPLAMYAFEFSKTLDQDDLINIWQNLPPKFNNSFERTGATIEIKELVDELLGREGNLQWLVFKVKMRGRMDYNIFKEQMALRSANINASPITEPVLNLPYSYNWPYDFFSMVELVRIGQQNTFVTEDILEREREEETPAPGTSPPGSPPPTLIPKVTITAAPISVDLPGTPGIPGLPGDLDLG
jgi:hypothetical protein